MKKATLSLLILFLLNSIYSHESVMFGQRNIKYAKTKYFDIIFAEGSEHSADAIFQCCDNYYEDLSNKFKLESNFRLPVVISAGTDNSNAYFSSAPFNHIVIYDTPSNEDLSVFSEEIKSTFRHELIHAITYNCNNKNWSSFKKVMGDIYTGSLITISLSDAEGATVSLESEFGEGRMNSEFHKQTVLQAKLENKFPKYSEVLGARDIIPSGNTSYYFGGAFSKYLQETYGMEKYAEYWYKCCNLPKISNLISFLTFKQVYGNSIEEIWNDFYNSIAIPNIPSNPSDENFCSDLLNPLQQHKSIYNLTYLSSFNDSFVFYDSFNKKIQTIDFSNKPKLKKLFSHRNLNSINFSQDGRYAIISYTDTGNPQITNRAKIYDTKSKTFYSLKEKHISDAIIFSKNEKLYAAVKTTKSQFVSLKVYEIATSKNGFIKNEKTVFNKDYNFEENLFSLSNDSYGNIYFIFKKNLDYSIHSIDFESDKEIAFKLPLDKMIIHGLRYSKTGKFSFSYTTPENMPRLGIVEFSNDEANYSLNKNFLSGSVYSPVILKDGNVIYIAKFYESSGLYKLDTNKLDFENFSCTKENYDFNKDESKLSILDNAKPFSVLKYGFSEHKRTLIPFSIAQTYAISKRGTGLLSTFVPIGFSYATSVPWTIPYTIFSAGYNPFTNSAAVSLQINGGSYVSNFLSYNTIFQVEFDELGYKQANNKTSISSKIPFNNNLYLSFGENLNVFEGRQSDLEKGISLKKNPFNYLNAVDSEERFFTINKSSIGIGNIKSSGSGYYDYNGFELKALYNLIYITNTETFSDGVLYQNIGSLLSIRNSTVLPLELQCGILSNNLNFANYSLAAILFNYEIQKSTNKFPVLYSNRLSVSASYSGSFTEKNIKILDSWSINKIDSLFEQLFNNEMKYSDEANLTFSYTITPNLGSLSRSMFEFTLSASILYRFFPEKDSNNFGLSICGVTAF